MARMTAAYRVALKLLAHGTRLRYLHSERRLATPTPRSRALSILFSRRAAWEPALRSGFRGLPHGLHFDDLPAAALEPHDLIVPLSLDDARFLRLQPPHVRERVVPLPDAACTALCHEKPRLNRFLIDAGFSLHIPPMGDDLAPPFVCKPACGENSDDCLLVPDAAAQTQLADALARPGLFRQVAVPGAIEYATHFMVRDGVLVRELTVRYHHDGPLFIKGGAAMPALRTLGRCPDAATLQAMLRAIGYDGLGCANYKFEQGRLQLIEINPRIGGSLCDYFFSFLRSMPRTQRTRQAGCTNWTWLDSIAERESLGNA
jgi:hypothetical protein